MTVMTNDNLHLPQLTFGSHRTNMWRNDQYLDSTYVAVLHGKTESQPYVHRGPHLRLLWKEIHVRMRETICTCSRYQNQRLKIKIF